MEIFDCSALRMTLGEGAALEGVLAQCKPSLAIGIGTAGNGCLRRLSAYAEEVHSFDLVSPQVPAEEMPNVTLYTDDSRQQLLEALNGFAKQGRNVDFVLVDGDRSAVDARGDLDALLSSPALADTVILIHDVTNEQVRSGLDAVRYSAYPKVAHVNLDFVPGYMLRDPDHRHELGGGLGLVIVDATRTAYFPDIPVIESRYYEAGHFYPQVRDWVVARERGEPASPAEVREQRTLTEELAVVREEHERYRHLSEMVTSSLSWKITAPLRAAMHSARRAAKKVP
ncbi:MAG TPA: class I SAM-dependent methyltransferase [Solirubrobacterales bacterium]|nr:class I SAM-dependent methyltransferase [Solirubrobacterales bacterium]